MRISVSEKHKFILRTAGIFRRDESVLLHRADHEDIWTLPGGGCDFFEDTKGALVREAREELNASIEVLSLAFAVENFFEWEGQMAHEIGFYYFARFTGDSSRLYDRDEFMGVEDKMEGFGRIPLHFKWMAIKDLTRENVKPRFLQTELSPMTNAMAHVIHRDG